MRIHKNKIDATDIIFDDGVKYWGQYELDGEYANPRGIGLFAKSNFEYYMSENLSNGMTIESFGVTHFEIGYYVNQKPRGHRLIYKGDVKYCFINEEGNADGFVVTIFKDGTYSIGRFFNNEFDGKIISYRFGKMFLEESNEIVNYLDHDFEHHCGYLTSLSMGAFWPTRFARPRKMTVKEVIHKDSRGYLHSDVEHDFEYTYNGATQCIGEGYTIDKKTHKEIWNDSNGFGFEYFNKGEFYFGEYSDDSRSGMGCYKFSDGSEYLGAFLGNYRTGPGMLVNGNNVSLGEFRNNKKDGIFFEIEGDNLFIKKYKSSNLSGIYFKVNKDDLSIEKYDESNKFIECVSFNDPHRIPNMSKKDMIDPKMISYLDENFEYEILDDLKIIILKCLTHRVSYIFPDDTIEIKNDIFIDIKRQINKIELSSQIIKLDEGCFRGTNVSEFVINNVIEVIPPYTLTSENIECIVFPENVKRIESNAFSKCSKLSKVYIKNNNCVIEKNAFPKWCNIIYPNDEKKNKVKKVKDNKTKRVRKYRYSIGDFFDDVLSFFKKLFGGIGEMFGVGTKGVIGAFKSGSILSILPMIGLIILGVIGVTNKYDILSWQITFNGTLFGYSLELCNLVIEWFENTDHDFFTALTLGLFQILLMAVGFILDIIVHIILFIFSLIWLLLQVIFQFIGQYLLPVILLGISVLIYIRSNEEKKSFALVCLVIGIIGALLYYLCGFIHV